MNDLYQIIGRIRRKFRHYTTCGDGSFCDTNASFCEQIRVELLAHIERTDVMGIRELEKAILEELRSVTGNKTLRLKDIMEWRTTTIKPREDEKLVYLPGVGVNVAYKEKLA